MAKLFRNLICWPIGRVLIATSCFKFFSCFRIKSLIHRPHGAGWSNGLDQVVWNSLSFGDDRIVYEPIERSAALAVAAGGAAVGRWMRFVFSHQNTVVIHDRSLFQNRRDSMILKRLRLLDPDRARIT
jgi:hypothetical protein